MARRQENAGYTLILPDGRRMPIPVGGDVSEMNCYPGELTPPAREVFGLVTFMPRLDGGLDVYTNHKSWERRVRFFADGRPPEYVPNDTRAVRSWIPYFTFDADERVIRISGSRDTKIEFPRPTQRKRRLSNWI